MEERLQVRSWGHCTMMPKGERVTVKSWGHCEMMPNEVEGASEAMGVIVSKGYNRVDL